MNPRPPPKGQIHFELPPKKADVPPQFFNSNLKKKFPPHFQPIFFLLESSIDLLPILEHC